MTHKVNGGTGGSAWCSDGKTDCTVTMIIDH